MTSTASYWGAMTLFAELFLGALVRWARTPQTHPDHAARGYMVRLLALLLVGIGGSAMRDQYLPDSPWFWILGVLLIPVAGAAAYIALRLFRTYRGSQSSSGPRVGRR